jgi:hypothetical protein
MRTRILITAFALAVAGCSGSTATTDATGTTAPATTTTTEPAAEPVLFAYSYAAGDSFSYDISLDQHLTMDMSVEGDPGIFGDQENTPSNIDVHTSVSGSVNYDLSDGPQPDTTTLHISGVFDNVSIDGTVDGQPATDEDLQSGTVPDLVEVPETTIVLDKYGRPISVDDTTVPTDSTFFGDPFSMLGGFSSGGLDQPFGPEFPDHPLAVGDSWTEELSQDIPDSDQAVSTSVTYTVTGTDSIDGHDVFTIDFSANASGVDIDLGEMFQALLEGFASMGDEGSTQEAPSIEFTVSLGESSGMGTYWFDQEAGIVRKVQQTYQVPMTMHMAIDSTEGSGSTDVQMSVESTVEATLGTGGASS